MFKKLIKYSKSEFVVNASKLMTGTVISQVIPIMAAPILSRIYLPADYGVLGLYMSVTGLISMFATLQYANAIVIAKNEEEVHALIKLCLQILIALSSISFLIIAMFHNIIGDLLKSNTLGVWLWISPLSIIMNGLSGIFGNYAVRHKQFMLVSTNRIISTISSTLVSITLGYITKSPIGLFAGLWINQIINGILLASTALRKTGESWIKILKSDLGEIKKTYINFPKYSLPADFINNFTNQIPVFMINNFGSVSSVGNFNMSNRILGLPIGFVSNAFGEVFRQKAANDYNTKGSCREVFVKTFKTLSLISIVPFGIIMFFGPSIFAFALGEKWRIAGIYSQIMGIMFFFRFTVSPLTYVYIIANKQKEDFYLHFLFLLVSYLSFFIGYRLTNSIEYALFIYAVLYSLIYCVYLMRSYQFSNKIPQNAI